MPFIGIVSDEKSENYIRREIVDNLKLRESSVLFIKEKSIENIKNIKFETIIFARKFKNMEILKKILSNASYLIINTDRIKNLEIVQNLKAKVLTFGFNSKAMITASSVTEEESLICVKQEIKGVKDNNIEPQEIKINSKEDAESIMAVVSTLLLYEIKK